MKKILFFLSFTFLCLNLAGETQIEKEMKDIKINSLKKSLKNDFLMPEFNKKVDTVNAIKEERSKLQSERNLAPNSAEFWNFISELWLVRNISLLKWDFEKPEYGIEPTFERILEKLGYRHVKFNILLMNTPVITHSGLPSDKNNRIYILSLPFIRTLDLSKIEISLLLLEDFIRQDLEHFQVNLTAKLYKVIIGADITDKNKVNAATVELLDSYSKLVFEGGHNFKQTYEVTKKMDQLLKGEPQLWNAYLKLLHKMDNISKNNLLYKRHSQLFPSPELQIKWLNPSTK